MKDFIIKAVIVGVLAFFAWKGYQAYLKGSATTEQNRQQTSVTEDLLER